MDIGFQLHSQVELLSKPVFHRILYHGLEHQLGNPQVHGFRLHVNPAPEPLPEPAL